MATNTAARPTKLWNPANNSGIAVIGISKAIKAPTAPPNNNKVIHIKKKSKLPIDKKWLQ